MCILNNYLHDEGLLFLTINVLLIFFQENLAFGKQTNQSGTDQGGASGRGVDGDSTTGFSQGSCTLTTQENNPWWIVDLGQVEPVSEVYIVNRGDSLGNRLSNFEIRVGRLAFPISPLIELYVCCRFKLFSL